MDRTFVGFGFGAIQAGLFLPEAYGSGNFSRLVVSEIDTEVVTALRGAGGSYSCNVAGGTSIETVHVEGVEIFNPMVEEDRTALVQAIAEATELVTALPSFTLYDAGEASVAKLLAQCFSKKLNDDSLPDCVVYAAENDTRAATRLKEACQSYNSAGFGGRAQFLETVIGKMSSVVTDPNRITNENLTPIVPGLDRALLVEAFNRILVDQVTLPDFERGLSAFIEKPDLAPFAAAKIFGHNAIHALLGYLAHEQGLHYMHEAGKHEDMMDFAKEAFLTESGVGLRHKYAGVADDLFTEEGFEAYTEDLLTRMVNPFLRDPVERVIRDPARKLGWDDRLLGSMLLAAEAGVVPSRLTRGASIALGILCQEKGRDDPSVLLDELWEGVHGDHRQELQQLILNS
jgi:mannitol-1-phosphate 5-dehydrogenase